MLIESILSICLTVHFSHLVYFVCLKEACEGEGVSDDVYISDEDDYSPGTGISVVQAAAAAAAAAVSSNRVAAATPYQQKHIIPSAAPTSYVSAAASGSAANNRPAAAPVPKPTPPTQQQSQQPTHIHIGGSSASLSFTPASSHKVADIKME